MIIWLIVLVVLIVLISLVVRNTVAAAASAASLRETIDRLEKEKSALEQKTAEVYKIDFFSQVDDDNKP
ncbi:MAG: hypothetical protein MUC35_06010 [Candidatus Margulisbacteria bacterium]|jgi:Tfp pilus assembly protein PilN|nr:hypothetical protein [Candidatus Margulisiibacteriota bacterium]